MKAFLTLFALLLLPEVAHAQPPVYVPRLSTIDFQDAPLSEALEMLFQVGGNPAHVIDSQTSSVAIKSLVLHNIAWDAAIRQIANFYNFKLNRDAQGVYYVTPRVPLNATPQP